MVATAVGLVVSILAWNTAVQQSIIDAEPSRHTFLSDSLLLEPNDLPDNWIAGTKVALSPREATGSLDGAVVFVRWHGVIADTGGVTSLQQYSYHYKNELTAKARYARLGIVNGSENPTDWRFTSRQADQSVLYCTPSPIQFNAIGCTWIGQYDEYIVELRAGGLGRNISWQAFQSLVELSDAKTTNVLGK